MPSLVCFLVDLHGLDASIDHGAVSPELLVTQVQADEPTALPGPLPRAARPGGSNPRPYPRLATRPVASRSASNNGRGDDRAVERRGGTTEAFDEATAARVLDCGHSLAALARLYEARA